MTKLNQLLVIEKGVKTASSQTMTQAYHDAQKNTLFNGVRRVYSPKDDDGDRLPDESQKVVLDALDVLHKITDSVARYLDVAFEKDVANAEAKADIEVDGQVVLMDVPVTYLLFLEKQLTDLQTFISKLPTLDPGEDWQWNENSGVYESNDVMTNRTQKVPRAYVMYEATDKHPAQVQAYSEDVIVGTWQTTKLSGALPTWKVRSMLIRVKKLKEAVKVAREKANSIEVPHVGVSPGYQIFQYVINENE